jgi:hypothetical protein
VAVQARPWLLYEVATWDLTMLARTVLKSAQAKQVSRSRPCRLMMLCLGGTPRVGCRWHDY